MRGSPTEHASQNVPTVKTTVDKLNLHSQSSKQFASVPLINIKTSDIKESLYHEKQGQKQKWKKKIGRNGAHVEREKLKATKNQSPKTLERWEGMKIYWP